MNERFFRCDWVAPISVWEAIVELVSLRKNKISSAAE